MAQVSRKRRLATEPSFQHRRGGGGLKKYIFKGKAVPALQFPRAALSLSR
jgi:hypothetical protein